jgi:hypothetical protein
MVPSTKYGVIGSPDDAKESSLPEKRERLKSF